MSDEERRAAAARSSAGDIGMSTDDDLSPTRDVDGGLNPTVDGPNAVPSVAQLLMFLHQQNSRMENLMTMMQHDRP